MKRIVAGIATVPFTLLLIIRYFLTELVLGVDMGMDWASAITGIPLGDPKGTGRPITPRPKV